MKLVKPSPGLIAEFKAVTSQLPQAQPRKMFGYDALFVNGNMAVGLWQNTCVVKVSEADQAQLLKRRHAWPFAPMKGRVMTGWIELSEELAHDPEELLGWSARAVAFVSTLPPKLKPAREKPSPKPAKKSSPKPAKKPSPKPAKKPSPKPAKKPSPKPAKKRAPPSSKKPPARK